MSAAQAPFLAELFVAATAGSLLMTALVAKILERMAVLDLPNARSSHSRPTPRGGGWAIWLTIAPLLAMTRRQGGDESAYAGLIIGFCGLLAVSWWDDCRNLPARVRLGAQIAAVWLGLRSFMPDALFFHGLLPGLADRAVAGFAWLWFINLFNFMDGIDGISATETLVICSGILAIGCATDGVIVVPWLELAALLGGAALGFAAHNWNPARLFLGDVGSIPLGFLLGWLLLGLDGSGYWLAALLLPAYYLADSSITLLIRLRRGERVWEAHRQHFYQRAAHEGGWTHGAIVSRIALLGMALIALSIATVLWSGWYAVPGFVAVGGLLWRLKRAGRSGP